MDLISLINLIFGICIIIGGMLFIFKRKKIIDNILASNKFWEKLGIKTTVNKITIGITYFCIFTIGIAALLSGIKIIYEVIIKK